MIKSTELRIGNLVHWLGQNIQVEGHFMAGWTAKGENRLKLPNPIPLTPEWLERLGFILVEDDAVPSKRWYKVVDEKVNFDVELDARFLRLITCDSEGYTYIDHSVPLRYVHQLQNLFFALTGEELTVKEVAHG